MKVTGQIFNSGPDFMGPILKTRLKYLEAKYWTS